jgi:calcium/calmodulin-dependent protein kinase I
VKHPFVVQFKEVFEEENDFIIVMEYIEGENLLSYVLRKRALPEETAKRIFVTICFALQAIHSKGLIHRDIKMENILAIGEGTASPPCKILDFGLTHSIQKVNSSEIKAIKNCGTPGYIAPELIEIGLYDFAFDIFSLGIVLYIMVTACFPFAGKNQKEIIQKNLTCIVNLSSPKLSHLSKDLKELLACMIVKDPNERITMDKIMAHPWVSGIVDEAEGIHQTTKVSLLKGIDTNKMMIGPSSSSKVIRKKSTQKIFENPDSEPNGPKPLSEKNLITYQFLMAQGSSVRPLIFKPFRYWA